MNESVEGLRALIADHQLTRARVAELCGVAESTVDTWLAPPGASSHRAMPGRHLELLRAKLKGKRKGGQ